MGSVPPVGWVGVLGVSVGVEVRDREGVAVVVLEGVSDGVAVWLRDGVSDGVAVWLRDGVSDGLWEGDGLVDRQIGSGVRDGFGVRDGLGDGFGVRQVGVGLASAAATADVVPVAAADDVTRPEPPPKATVAATPKSAARW